MEFRTQIPITKNDLAIDYHSKILSLGSCFADNIGQKLTYYKFQNTVNPFGIIFNPASIENLIQRCINKKYFTESDVFFHHDLWNCFEVHSKLSNVDKDKFVIHLNELLNHFYGQISNATHILITYGTSWVYRNSDTNEIVANCHKVPQKQFVKELLSVDAISRSISNSIELIQSMNPNVQFVFTVSPVRHIKDGFVENTLSKAHLIAALQSFLKVSTLGAKGVYFPSYEIMMDELRDYRFYKEDMLHPNKIAVDYIWERFSETHFSLESISVMEEVATIQKGLMHRPFNPDSLTHQKFLLQLNQKISELQKKLFADIFLR